MATCSKHPGTVKLEDRNRNGCDYLYCPKCREEKAAGTVAAPPAANRPKVKASIATKTIAKKATVKVAKPAAKSPAAKSAAAEPPSPQSSAKKEPLKFSGFGFRRV